jgi:hypothetical protein
MRIRRAASIAAVCFGFLLGLGCDSSGGGGAGAEGGEGGEGVKANPRMQKTLEAGAAKTKKK